MRKLAMVAAIALVAMPLGGCIETLKAVLGGGSPGGVVVAPPAPSTDNAVVDIINQAPGVIARGCQVAVTVGQVANVVAAFGVPYVGMLDDVADAFCKAFDRAGARGVQPGGEARAVVVVQRRNGTRAVVRVSGRRI